MTTTTEPTTALTRTAPAATVGGALWLVMPAAWIAPELSGQEPGGPGFVAVAISYWTCLVLAPALLAAAAWRLPVPGAGRARAIGAVTTGAGLAAMAVGNAVEVGSIMLGGGEEAVGHVTFLAGYLVSVLGGIVLGTTLARRGRDALSRTAGWVLALALPLGLGVGYLGSLVSSGTDIGFWAAISVPTGLAFLLLGRALGTTQRAAR